jgi:hypothetical protein
MKIADFRGEITSNGQILVPPEIAPRFLRERRLSLLSRGALLRKKMHGRKQAGVASILLTFRKTRFMNN